MAEPHVSSNNWQLPLFAVCILQHFCVAAAEFNGVIYALGGFDGKDYLMCVSVTFTVTNNPFSPTPFYSCKVLCSGNCPQNICCCSSATCGTALLSTKKTCNHIHVPTLMQSVFCAFWHSQELPLSLTVCRKSAACWKLYALGFSTTQFMVQCVRKPSHRSFCEMADFCLCEDALLKYSNVLSQIKFQPSCNLQTENCKGDDSKDQLASTVRRYKQRFLPNM